MSTDRALRLQVILQAIDKATAPLSNLGRKSQAAAQALKATQDELRKLKQQQQAVGEFRQLTGELRSSAQQLRLMRQRVAELRAAHAAGGQATKAHAAELATAEKAVQRAAKAYEAKTRAVNATKARLSALGLKNVAADELRLADAIAAASRRADEQRARLTRLRDAWAGVKAARQAYTEGMDRAANLGRYGLSTGAAAYATSRPVVAAARAFMPNEDAATALRNAEMAADGSISAEFERIKALATDLGNRLPGTTADFLEMMTMLRRQGMASADVLGGLGEATAYLGVLLKLPAAEAAEFAAKMQDATQTPASDMMGLLDQIQRAYNLGVDPTNMLSAITKMAPAMTVLRKHGLGATKDLLPLLVLMDQAGMKGEAAGNAIRKVFQASVNADRRDKANAALRGTGIRLDMSDGKGEFGGMDKLFAELAKLKRLSSEKQVEVMKELFGDDAETLQVVATLMSKGMPGMQETTAKLQAQANLRQRVNEQLKTLSAQVDAAQGNAQNALAAFGEAMAPTLKSAVQWLGELASGVGAWARENQGAAAAVGYVVTGLAALLGMVAAVLLAITALLGPIAMFKFGCAGAVPVLQLLRTIGVGAFTMMGKAILFVGRALLANPIGLAIAAIATAAYLIYEHWEPIKAFFLNLWDGVKKIFWNAIDALLGPMRLLRDAFAAIGLNVPEIPRFGDAAAAAGSPVKVDDRPPLPAGAGQPRPVVVAGANMPVTINVPPGSDAKDIAREFERLQAKLQRDQAARARSTLHDAY